MAVSTTNAYSGPYLTNGVTTVFPFTFTAPSNAEVSVILRTAGGVDMTPSNFSVVLTPGGGGSVTFTSAPAAGSQLYVLLDPRFTQDIAFEDGSAWLASPVNEGYDRSAARDQVLKRDIDRGFKAPLGEGGIDLPGAAARAGKFLAFGPGGVPVTASGTGTDDALRQDLASPAAGLTLVAIRQPAAPSAPTIIRSAQQWVDGQGGVEGDLLGIRTGSSFENSAEINDALQVCKELGGKSLNLPAGEVFFEDTIGGLGGASNPGVTIKGMGIGQTILTCAADTAIKAIDLFDDWQYGFRMGGFTLQSLATLPGQIIPGSMGFHVERSQVPGIISEMRVQGFGTNIDVGVHAQFLHWQNIDSRNGNILVNAYGQNADMNVWDNCMFYAGVEFGTIISAPRNVFRDCWWGTANAWAIPDFVGVLIGYQAIRPEDVGKSSSTGPGARGHNGQNGALIRPRFEWGSSGLRTKPYIMFGDVDPYPGTVTFSQFVIDTPVFPNIGPVAGIGIGGNPRSGIQVLSPQIPGGAIPHLIEDEPSADGAIQYVAVTENTLPIPFTGQRSLMSRGSADFYMGAADVTDASATVTAGSDSTLTNDATNGVLRAVKGTGSPTELFRYSRSSAGTGDARFYLKAGKRTIGEVTLAAYTAGPNYIFRMRGIPVDVLADGVSIVVPGTAGQAVTLSVQVPALTAGEILFEKVLSGTEA